jgi:hypothetical protein
MVFSFVGWVFVGVPVVLFLAPRIVTHWSWLFSSLVGACLGPLALFIILVVLSRGRIHSSAIFTSTGGAFAFSILVSVVSFGVYAVLLRKATREVVAGNNRLH